MSAPEPTVAARVRALARALAQRPTPGSRRIAKTEPVRLRSRKRRVLLGEDEQVIAGVALVGPIVAKHAGGICPTDDAELIAACDPEILRALYAFAELAARALAEAKATIRTWHGEVAWEIYDAHAPEMRPVNAALATAHQLGLPTGETDG